jgi:hypothetical protein
MVNFESKKISARDPMVSPLSLNSTVVTGTWMGPQEVTMTDDYPSNLSVLTELFQLKHTGLST